MSVKGFRTVRSGPLSSDIAFDGLKEYYALSEKTLVITGADSPAGLSLCLIDQEIWLVKVNEGLWSIYRIKKYRGKLPPVIHGHPDYL